ncbi:hypothetical protein JCM1840_003476 [Sporobolomyces johnsonii]
MLPLTPALHPPAMLALQQLLQPHSSNKPSFIAMTSPSPAHSTAQLPLASLHFRYASHIDDADLLDSLPELPKSIVEEEEEEFQRVAQQALAYAASSPSPAVRVKSAGDMERSDSSYFDLTRRNLYHDGSDSSYSSSGGSSFSTPSSSYYDPSFEYSDSYTAGSSCSAGLSPFSNGYDSNTMFPSSSLTTSPVLSAPNAPAPSALASRRKSPAALKLSLLPLQLSSSSPARPALRSTASTSNLGSGMAMSSAARKPSWVSDFENIAGIEVPAVELPGSPVMLRREKRSNGFAF